MADVRKAWIDKGYSPAGGIWGEAAWKHITPDLVVGIMDDTAALPDQDSRECIVWVYRAPFWKGYADQWPQGWGEAPVEDVNDASKSSMHQFPTISAAEAFIASL